MNRIVIAGRDVGPGAPCFLIAEAGVNHNGDLDKAFELVEAAAAAGADAVKFQVIDAERMVTRDAPLARYQERNPGGTARTQYDMLKRLELPGGAYARLQDLCGRRGLVFLATPFETAGADLLAGLNVPAYKIGSGEITNPVLLAHVAALGRPVILSTGMATMDEIEAALGTLRCSGDGGIVLLHCVSCYPAEPEDANLQVLQTLRKAFDLPVGFSDHTRGIEIAPAAVAMGACVIEKHFTLDRSLPGPDHSASIEPSDLARLVRTCRTVERALGDGRKQPTARELEIARVARRSLTAARPIPCGARLAAQDIALRRPGTGLPPLMLDAVIGCRAVRDIPAGAVLAADMLALPQSRPSVGAGERRAA